ncbi:hypothetical protein PspLS_06706 [Pyricularia sp. CBS 133598]|nr:hypothetical protein PspLS_06706 [Pyricularia sp. CBS 133598]
MVETPGTDVVDQNESISAAKDMANADQAVEDKTPKASEALPVLIIGSGSAGLALAQGLKKHNVPAIVFERDSSLDQARRWGFVMVWSAPILKSLITEDAWSRSHTTLSDPSLPVKEVDTIPMYNGATGVHLVDFPFPKAYRLYRPRFRELLAEGVDIQFGKKLAGFTTSEGVVTAHFEDGTQHQGRLLVGADGSKSMTRTLLLGEDRSYLKRLPFAAIFVLARYPKEQALYIRNFKHPIALGMLHPENMVSMVALLDAPSPDEPEKWIYANYIGWRVTPEEQDEYHKSTKQDLLDQVKKLATKFADSVKSAFDWLPEAADDEGVDNVWFSPSRNWDPRIPDHEWSNHGGLVTLAGDAAHPMTYQRGQGFNNAIDDAGYIVRLLSDANSRSQKELIDEYEVEMKARGGREVELSEGNTFMVHNWDMVMSSPLLNKGLAKSPPADPSAAPHPVAGAIKP